MISYKAFLAGTAAAALLVSGSTAAVYAEDTSAEEVAIEPSIMVSVTEDSYPDLVDGALNKSELEYVLGTLSWYMGTDGWNNFEHDMPYLINELAENARYMDSSPIAVLGQTTWSASDLTRVFASFSDLTFSEANAAEVQSYIGNAVISGDQLSFTPASPSRSANAQILSAEYTEDEMLVHFLLTQDSVDYGISANMPRVAILEMSDTGKFKITAIAEDTSTDISSELAPGSTSEESDDYEHINIEALDSALNGENLDLSTEEDSSDVPSDGYDSYAHINIGALDAALNGENLDLSTEEDSSDVPSDGDDPYAHINIEALDAALNGENLDLPTEKDPLDIQINTENTDIDISIELQEASQDTESEATDDSEAIVISSNWAELYAAVLDRIQDGSYEILAADDSFRSTSEGFEYFLQDIDSDELPELIVGELFVDQVFYKHAIKIFTLQQADEGLMAVEVPIQGASGTITDYSYVQSMRIPEDGYGICQNEVISRGTGDEVFFRNVIQNGVFVMNAETILECRIDEDLTAFYEANPLVVWIPIENRSGLDQ